MALQKDEPSVLHLYVEGNTSWYAMSISRKDHPRFRDDMKTLRNSWAADPFSLEASRRPGETLQDVLDDAPNSLLLELMESGAWQTQSALTAILGLNAAERLLTLSSLTWDEILAAHVYIREESGDYVADGGFVLRDGAVMASDEDHETDNGEFSVQGGILRVSDGNRRMVALKRILKQRLVKH
jgi:hypothetical protein